MSIFTPQEKADNANANWEYKICQYCKWSNKIHWVYDRVSCRKEGKIKKLNDTCKLFKNRYNHWGRAGEGE